MSEAPDKVLYMEEIMKTEKKTETRPADVTINLAPTVEDELKDTDYICVFCGATTTDPDRAKYSCYTCQEYKGWVTIGEAKRLGEYEAE
jgi:hypothetical protein